MSCRRRSVRLLRCAGRHRVPCAAGKDLGSGSLFGSGMAARRSVPCAAARRARVLWRRIPAEGLMEPKHRLGLLRPLLDDADGRWPLDLRPGGSGWLARAAETGGTAAWQRG